MLAGGYTMKRILLVLSCSFLLFGCGGNANNTDDKEVLSMKKESKVLDLMGNDKFDLLERVDVVVLGKWIDEGYEIYTIDDGEKLENLILSAIGEYEDEVALMHQEYDGKIEVPDIATSYDDHIRVFAKNILKAHPDKKEYIEKLHEANKLIEDKNNEAVEKKIDEARKLRE